MNCKNCGTPLMGMEHACPVCGAPLPAPQPRDVSGVVVDPAQPVMPQQMASQPPQMLPAEGQIEVLGLQQQPEEVKEEPKKANNMFAILLLIVAFAAIGVGVFLAMTDSEEESAAPVQDNTPQEPTTSTVSYAGFSFTLPANFSSNVEGNNGLVIRANDTIYTILVDYTKNYEYYKGEFTKVNDKAPCTTETVSSHEYTFSLITDSTGAQAIEYMTSATETATFVGLIIKSDFSKPGEDTYTELNSILETAIQQTTINPGDAEDAGKTEIVNYIPKFSKENFLF